jgi:hypothetical protein
MEQVSSDQGNDPVSPGTGAARMSISMRFLLGIYGIVPLCLLAMILDRQFAGGYLSTLLPDSPQNFFIFQILFGTPHIIASAVILATNTNYLYSYRVRLVLFSLFLLAFFGLGSLVLSYDMFLAIVGSVTILHVIKQQVGIGKGICRVSGRVYDAWGWCLIVFGSIMYFMIFTRYDIPERVEFWVHNTLWGLAVLAVMLSAACHLRSGTFNGRLYLWANTLMVLQSGLLYAEGYSFLAILGPRLVHDLTAFTFYIAHDVNRHGAKAQNLLYRVVSKLGLGIFWVCPVVAILSTYLIGSFADPLVNYLVTPVLGYDVPYGASFLIVGYLAMLHYYTEAFTWQSGSAYRQHVAFRQ